MRKTRVIKATVHREAREGKEGVRKNFMSASLTKDGCDIVKSCPPSSIVSSVEFGTSSCIREAYL